jgi:hypothetical protein
MHTDVFNPLFHDWYTCFPTFDQDKEELSPDEVNADYIRSLVPVGNEGTDHNNEGCDYAMVLEEEGVHDILYDWFENNVPPNECIDD